MIYFVFRLILYAVLNAILENNEVANLFFETATTEDSENVVAWTLYGMLNKKKKIILTNLIFI